ncbi:helix-turn-helix domain-containing protein [Knoellia locipacati]|uniref:Putative regulatory protein, ArsR family n=1 Tax=Knoellia locipacati TaxID=882824 RepID=A0A512T0C2_9MICO|nr:ArsR family transcriptional regulator [Knoellia locipacati]GEQ13633.1 putative regulatory protein, ArsR family [Knoellia locipacati]
MNTEQTDEHLRRRVTAHSALADVTRLRIVDLLAVSDRSASELGLTLGIASNLLAHHLRSLEHAGLVTRRRSEGDGRRSYLSLNAHDAWLLREAGAGTAQVRASRVVFVCTANTARSHLAAAAWRRVSDIPATSAGTHPGAAIHPGALAAAERHSLDLPDVAPRPLDDPVGRHDLVVTVCDRAHEELGGRDWAHWSIPDPVPAHTDLAFDEAYDSVVGRVERLADVVTDG